MKGHVAHIFGVCVTECVLTHTLLYNPNQTSEFDHRTPSTGCSHGRTGRAWGQRSPLRIPVTQLSVHPRHLALHPPPPPLLLLRVVVFRSECRAAGKESPTWQTRENKPQWQPRAAEAESVPKCLGIREKTRHGVRCVGVIQSRGDLENHRFPSLCFSGRLHRRCSEIRRRGWRCKVSRSARV